MSNSIYVYGGSFNPIHLGHISVIETLVKKFTEAKVVVVPAKRSPLKEFDYDPGIEHRIHAVKKATDYLDVVVDDYELKQDKKNYTVDILPYLKEKYESDDINIVVGLDQLKQFHLWKNYQKVLTEANLLVVSRPGFDFLKFDELPVELQDLTDDYTNDQFILSTGKKISYLQLSDDIDVSSSELRAKMRKGLSVGKLVPEDVKNYYIQENIYERLDNKVNDFEDFTMECAKVLQEKNALNVFAYDVRNITQPSDFNLIASGTNTRHTSSLAEHLIRFLRKTQGISPIGIEGLSEGRWVVIDYGSLIVHVFYEFVRSEYNLEELWSSGKKINS